MKYINLILFSLLSGCGLRPHIPFLRKLPGPNEELPPPPAQPPIIDPLDLIIDGKNTGVLSEQSHMDPFFTIIILVLIICLTPMLYEKCIKALPKLKPHAIDLKEWVNGKFAASKEWVKSKLKEKKLDSEEK